MGRVKSPAVIKQLRGTDQPCRMDGGGVWQPISAVPKVPKHFTKNQRIIFKNVCEQMVNLGLLNLVNVDLVAAYAREMGNYHDAEVMLQDRYRAIENTDADTDSPYIVSVPTKHGSYDEVKALRRHSKDCLKAAKELAKEFGFTPTTMGRLPGGNSTDEDALLKLLGM